MQLHTCKTERTRQLNIQYSIFTRLDYNFVAWIGFKLLFILELNFEVYSIQFAWAGSTKGMLPAYCNYHVHSYFGIRHIWRVVAS